MLRRSPVALLAALELGKGEIEEEDGEIGKGKDEQHAVGLGWIDHECLARKSWVHTSFSLPLFSPKSP
jgi:hypothetical protein